MNAFRMAAAMVSVVLMTMPAWGGEAEPVRHDPYAGYRAGRAAHRVSDPPRSVEHRPRLIRPEPLVRAPRVYRHAPQPVEVRVRAQAPRHESVTAALAGHGTVVIDRPLTRSRAYRYEDIGRARVVRNPLVDDDRVTWRTAEIGPVRVIRRDSYLGGLRDRPILPRTYISIRSYGGDHCDRPIIYRRSIQRWWHDPGPRRCWSRVPRFHRPIRPYCAPASGVTLFFQF